MRRSRELPRRSGCPRRLGGTPSLTRPLRSSTRSSVQVCRIASMIAGTVTDCLQRTAVRMPAFTANLVTPRHACLTDAGQAGSIRTPGLSIPARVQLGLGGAQRGGERGRALAVVPGAVVAADRVVVGDRAAALDHRLGGGGLDLVPLLDLAAPHRRRHHREVGRRPVGVDVGEAAADPWRARPLGGRAADLGDLRPHRLHRRRRGTPRSGPR